MLTTTWQEEITSLQKSLKREAFYTINLLHTGEERDIFRWIFLSSSNYRGKNAIAYPNFNNTRSRFPGAVAAASIARCRRTVLLIQLWRNVFI